MIVSLVIYYASRMFLPSEIANLLARSYTCILGAIFVISVAAFLHTFPFTSNKYITWLGNNTLPIYLTQGIVYKGLDAYCPEIHNLGLLYPVIVLAICVFITFVLNSNKFTKWIIKI